MLTRRGFFGSVIGLLGGALAGLPLVGRAEGRGHVPWFIVPRRVVLNEAWIARIHPDDPVLIAGPDINDPHRPTVYAGAHPPRLSWAGAIFVSTEGDGVWLHEANLGWRRVA